MTKKYRKRMLCVLILFAACLLVFTGRLMNLQLVQGEDYAQKAIRKSLRTVSLPALRGGIYDRNGLPLVVNDMGYSIKLDKVLLPGGESDADTGKTKEKDVYLALLEMLQKNGFPYEDALPITQAPYGFDVIDENDERGQKELEKLFSFMKYDAKITAEGVMADLVKRYGLEGYSTEEQRILAGLIYDTKLQGFSVTNMFTVAQGVDAKTVTMIKERNFQLPGVVVEAEPIRTFVSQGSAAHILGQIGSIDKENSEAYAEAGYLLSDKVGRSGIEKTMEEALRGTPGEKTVNSNLTTGEMSTTVTREPIPGNNVYLTIDLNLQRTLERSMAKAIRDIAAKGTPGKNNGADANAGGAVMLDVKSGEVLAMASYPTYDPADYRKNYTTLASDEMKPLLNRAIQGTYAPGSTFKIATALAALDSGVIGVKDKIYDKGKYDFYKDYQPRCWVYTDYGYTHGKVDVAEAIRVSCNYYFYEVGRLTGIDKLNAMCRQLGLGEKTGINLPGEAAGILAGPDYTEKLGEPWWGGLTLSAAIGQSYNQFTPLQLANYLATVVNGGFHYQPQIVSRVMDYHNEAVLQKTSPTVKNQIQISDEIYQALMAGMRSVTEDGTASNVFANYDINVGGKTGTATVTSGTASGVFIAFAPVEDPQVAIAIVLEHGAHGNYAAPVAKQMMDAYFKGIFVDENGNTPPPTPDLPENMGFNGSAN